MSTVNLVTKFFIPPIRSELVQRPDLIKRLNQGLDRKLTLISAPAGFGKTTLACEWLGNLGRDEDESQDEYRIAWLSLDESDNDLIRFLNYFISALNRIDGIETDLGQGALNMLHSPQPPPVDSILTSLINDIAVTPNNIIFVLDDFHLIETQSVHNAIIYLLEHLPPQLHLVIATREDPRLNLPRLRARDQIAELRAADLRFAISESSEFLNQVMDLDLSTEDIATLETRTEGWIAGLQLAAISMRSRTDATNFIQSFSGSHRLVLDYLIEEVLNQKSENIQSFLLQTSILNRLTGSLCDAITGQNNAQQTLDLLDRSNLFIVPLDEERCCFRYHHLFADLLRQRLDQTRPEQRLILHQRASEWFEQHGDDDEAIAHALRANDFERAARLIEKASEVVWVRSEDIKFRGWLDQLPDEILLSNPQLCIVHAWHLYLSGQMEAAEQRLLSAERLLSSKTDRPPDFDMQTLLGRVAIVRSVLVSVRGDMQRLIEYAHQALENLPEHDLYWRSTAIMSLGDAYGFIGDLSAAYRYRVEALEISKALGSISMTLFSSLNLVFTLRDMGRLQEAQELIQNQLELAKQSGLSQTAVVGWLTMIWGEIFVEKNNLDRGLTLAQKGAELVESGNDVIMLSWSRLCLMRVLFSCGDMTSAREVIQKAHHLALEQDVPDWSLKQLEAWNARLWLVQGELAAASQWAQELGLDLTGDLSPEHDFDYVILARIYIAQKRLGEVSKLLQRLLQAAKTGERTSKIIEILILQSLAFQTDGNIDQAMNQLEAALAIAEPLGFLRIFVDEGPPMARLLYEALKREIAPDYVNRLIHAFPSEPEQSKLSDTQSSDIVYIEPLSDREIEVLQLVAEGLTNPMIASRLFLSLHTVKVHTRNIYGKLGVHNRTEAVAKARALGVLPTT